MLTVEAIANAGVLSDEIKKKAVEFVLYLDRYIYGDYFEDYQIDDQVCIEEITYST